MDGVLNINKPSGISSHDAVQQVRRLLGQKRIGHTGTLDPLATGVLVLCIGKATRIARFLEAGEKEYEATLRLGVTTDTLDREGRVLDTRTYEPPEKSDVVRVLNGFIGTIMQRPPAYSAIKVGGVPSYKLARAGKDEPHKPRPVTIYGIDLAAYDDPVISIRVRCSKGVYIRVLCADIGEALGPGAHLTSLVRTRSGCFSIDDAFTLDQLALLPESMDRAIVSIDKALDAIPAVSLNEKDAGRIVHGNRIVNAEGRIWTEGMLVRTHDQTGRLIALSRTRGGELTPEIVFS